MKKLVIVICCFFFHWTNITAQQYEVEDLRIALNRGKCFQASIHIDKNNILDNSNKTSYYGDLGNQDSQAAFEISAYPQGENPSAHNRLTVVAYSRTGGHQELSLTYRGNMTVFYPDKIKSYKNSYGSHFELGKKGGNVIDQLLLKENIKIDVTEKVCGSHTAIPNQQVVIVEVPQSNSNEGCSELHDAITRLGKSMYPKFHEEDVRLNWVNANTKKVYDLPKGCIDRDRELDKLYSVAGSIYPKFHQDNEKRSWFKNMMNKSFDRPCNYRRGDLAKKIDDLLEEGNEIFDWHEEEKEARWLTKKINELLE